MILTAEADGLSTDAKKLLEDYGAVGCHSSTSNDLSVHAWIDSIGYVRLLWESSEEDDKNTPAAIFEVKFGKMAEGAITDSRQRTADTLYNDLESVELAIEGTNPDVTEDDIVPAAECIQDTKEEATGDQIRSSKCTMLCMPSPSRTGNEGTLSCPTVFFSSRQYFNKYTTSRSMSLLEMPMRQHTDITTSKRTKICTIPQFAAIFQRNAP